mmetsp:Transcript_26239/g.61284  ORF Transcript_26239/g.61284 Transcript_26239/m.61284 type:complete len:216 (-) Transcript_26239:700-1347(-)
MLPLKMLHPDRSLPWVPPLPPRRCRGARRRAWGDSVKVNRQLCRGRTRRRFSLPRRLAVAPPASSHRNRRSRKYLPGRRPGPFPSVQLPLRQQAWHSPLPVSVARLLGPAANALRFRRTTQSCSRAQRPSRLQYLRQAGSSGSIARSRLTRWRALPPRTLCTLSGRSSTPTAHRPQRWQGPMRRRLFISRRARSKRRRASCVPSAMGTSSRWKWR